MEVKGDWTMITPGMDAHKRTHTVVAVDEVGRQLATRSRTTTAGHLALVRWGEQLDGGQGREWAVEDSRHLLRRLEADLLGAGERITPPTVGLAEAA
jgi:transposase